MTARSPSKSSRRKKTSSGERHRKDLDKRRSDRTVSDDEKRSDKSPYRSRGSKSKSKDRDRKKDKKSKDRKKTKSKDKKKDKKSKRRPDKPIAINFNMNEPAFESVEQCHNLKETQSEVLNLEDLPKVRARQTGDVGNSIQ